MKGATSMMQSADHPVIWIALDDLCIRWPEAQRPLSALKARRMAENFNPDVLGVLTVSQKLPDGKHHVCDGWTRVNALLTLWNDPRQMVQCQVVQCNDAADAARIFREINGPRTKPAALHMYRTGVTQGTAAEVAVDRACRKAGLSIGMGSHDGCISGVASLLWLYNTHGELGLERTLQLLRMTWGLERAAYDAPLLRGFSAFLADLDYKLDYARLAQKLQRQHTAGSFLGAARASNAALGGVMPKTIVKMLENVNDKRASPAKARQGKRRGDAPPVAPFPLAAASE